MFSYDNEEAEKEDKDEDDDSESPSLASLMKEKVGKSLGKNVIHLQEEQMAQATRLRKHNWETGAFSKHTVSQLCLRSSS